ncbi:universal stress protein [Vibrio sp. ZSDE26]|uniref:Universal stress protein n=1 Tax=Vibrio amylolyticus TaxID=2847292 RepID=A0A9X2BGB3_9VIBR|nr:universal stress protein [Vibrio amylolyticus]MCK6262716.1 universal stress protein [Vibrio amylolyticus]
MTQFSNILFVDQGLNCSSDSLGQSIKLSTHNNADLQALIVCPSLPENMSDYADTYEQSLCDGLRTRICDVISKNNLDKNPNNFPITLDSGDKPVVRIIRHVQNQEIDLVIKEAEPIEESSKGFKAIDMMLLRQCPSPVWLSRPNTKPMTKRRVAVAIDPDISTLEQKKLSLKLLDVARSIADSSDSRLHIVTCWVYQLQHYLDNQSWIKMSDDELNQNIEQARLDHLAKLNALIAESSIGGENIVHHLHGVADTEIPSCVLDLGIDVLVMGTIARTGIPGVVIGNTAENILQHVSCSLVALKPNEFVSPIR